MSDDPMTLERFIDTYGPGRDVSYVDVPDDVGEAPFIVLRYGRHAVVVNPMGLDGIDGRAPYLDVDLHAFTDGVETGAESYGMAGGRRLTGPRDAGLVVVMVGREDPT